jgi:hypothetical protein
LTGSDDSTGLVWDLRPKIEVQDDPIPALLWDALAGANASAAYRAVWQLADRPDRSVPFLKAELTPAKPIDGRRLRELLDDLDSSRCADREAASKELAAWGEAIEPDLRRELTQSPSAEKRHRLQTLLDGLTAGLSSDNVRQVRAVVVLKWANTQGARRLLGELARGAPEARLTQEAKTSLELLSRGALPAP